MADANKKKSKSSQDASGAKAQAVSSDSSKPMGISKVDGTVIRELKKLYKEKLHPIESSYFFNKFNHPAILDSELSSKPTVLLVGQYSTGKTTFIRQLIGMDYPEMHIGPEPTTDKFIAIVHGEEKKILMGNTTTGVDDLPFSGLSAFGSSFLSKFSAAVVPSEILRTINIIDTPGVLSGEKQRTSRGYDFSQVCKWFAERSDMIILMFDCSKLDISDEFKNVIEQLQSHEDKVHCVLNKADQLDTESLMRVYGALLWSMGRIFKGAEVTRVYISSNSSDINIKNNNNNNNNSSSNSNDNNNDSKNNFENNNNYNYNHNNENFKMKNSIQNRLLLRDRGAIEKQLQSLPLLCSMRKINEIVKRIRLMIIHVCILSYLKSEMPNKFMSLITLRNKSQKQQEMMDNLPQVFQHVQRIYQLAPGDFPNGTEFKQCLAKMDFDNFPNLNYKVLSDLQDLLSVDIPRITRMVSGVSGDLITSSDDNNSHNNNNNDTTSSSTSRQPLLYHIAEDALDSAHRHRGRRVIIMTMVIIAVLGMIITAIMGTRQGLVGTLRHILQNIDNYYNNNNNNNNINNNNNNNNVKNDL